MEWLERGERDCCGAWATPSSNAPFGPHPSPCFHTQVSSKPSLSSSPSSLPALLFNSRNEFHIHLPRAQCRVTLPRLRFMFQCPERSGWRTTRSACPRTCVSVCRRVRGGGRTDSQCHRQKDGLTDRGRTDCVTVCVAGQGWGVGLGTGEGQALRLSLGVHFAKLLCSPSRSLKLLSPVAALPSTSGNVYCMVESTRSPKRQRELLGGSFSVSLGSHLTPLFSIFMGRKFGAVPESDSLPALLLGCVFPFFIEPAPLLHACGLLFFPSFSCLDMAFLFCPFFSSPLLFSCASLGPVALISLRLFPPFSFGSLSDRLRPLPLPAPCPSPQLQLGRAPGPTHL